MLAPPSSYSHLEIHICWKVVREDRMEPPIHTLYLDLDGRGGQSTQLFGHALTNARKHRVPAGQNDVGEQIPSHIQVAPHNGPEGGVLDATGLSAQEAGLEQHLRAAETLGSEDDK